MELATENNIDVLYTKNINSKEFLECIRRYPFDLFVSMSFNQIFRNEIREMPLLKIINCHAGKLPYGISDDDTYGTLLEKHIWSVRGFYIRL